MRLGRHHRWTKRRDEGRLRPPPLRHLRRQQAGCERHCDANAVTQSSRNMAGALFAGFQQEVVVIFVEGLDDLLDGMPSSRREWVKLRVATQDDCWLDFVRTGSGDTPSEKLGSGL